MKMTKFELAISMLHHREVNKITVMKIDGKYHLVIRNDICYLIII
jgi:hypothetical protein